MKRLQTCCCCASTRTGTMIIAVLGVLLSIATIVLMWTTEHKVTFSTFIFQWDQYDIPRIIVTINLCFTILICILLFVAVKKKSDKRRSWMMLPWVVLGIVLAIGLLISILHTSITFYLHDGENREGYDYTTMATIILVGGLLYLALYLYLWVVVFSHYLDTRDEEERGRYRKAPYRR